jgi:hypothetical protein
MHGLLRAARWLSLGGWLGSWALFAFVIAPTAFRLLPSGEIAGAFVAPVLRILHLYGVLAGLTLFAIAFALRERPLLVVLPAVLATLCAISQFGVTAAISDIRPSTFGPGTPDWAAARFGQLHMLSRLLFGLILIGVAALTVLHAVEPPPAGAPAPPSD